MAKDIEPKLKLISEYIALGKNDKFVIPEYQCSLLPVLIERIV